MLKTHKRTARAPRRNVLTIGEQSICVAGTGYRFYRSTRFLKMTTGFLSRCPTIPRQKYSSPLPHVHFSPAALVGYRVYLARLEPYVPHVAELLKPYCPQMMKST